MVRKKYRRAAEGAISKSKSDVQMSAVAWDGGSLIGVGWNWKKTHPKSLNRYKTIHAEEDLIRRFDLNGASVFVTRMRGNRCSKPCSSCELALVRAGVRRVYFLDTKGIVCRLW